MTLFDIVQASIIGILVLLSALHVLRRLLPKWTRARQTALAAWLNRPHRPSVMRAVGNWLQPGESTGGGCGSGCNTCSTCESNPDAEPATGGKTKPLTFHRHI